MNLIPLLINQRLCSLKNTAQAVISGNLNTLADGASVRPSARRPPVRSDSASKDGQVRCRAIPTQARAALASCSRHDPRQPTMILLYAASRDPRRGETPVMCASTVQVAAPPGEVVSNTGKQNRKVLAAPVMESFASITGVTTLLRQKHGNCPPPPIFLHSIPFSFVRRSNYRLPLIPSSDGSHACAAEMVRYREERNYEP